MKNDGDYDIAKKSVEGMIYKDIQRIFYLFMFERVAR